MNTCYILIIETTLKFVTKFYPINNILTIIYILVGRIFLKTDLKVKFLQIPFVHIALQI